MRNPFTLHVKNRTLNFDHIHDQNLRRRRVLDDLDRTHFQWLVVFVAGIGFLADGYDIYAASLTIPMLNHVYWNNQMPANVEAALSAATLAGTVIGQLFCGIFADVHGRNTMYGVELLIIIASTIGITMSSGGVGSMNMLGWLISWRFLLGVGIGGDRPLSAVITSEFAPTRSRGSMLATVFFMQPCGYLLATLVSMIALVGYKSNLNGPLSAATNSCSDDECRAALDSVWRWVIGFGAVPAALAIFMRFSIPESPRYTIEVLNRPDEALKDVNEMDLPTISSPTPGHVPGTEPNSPIMEMHSPRAVQQQFNNSSMRVYDDPQAAAIAAATDSEAADRRSWHSSVAGGSPMFRAASITLDEGIQQDNANLNPFPTSPSAAAARFHTSFGGHEVAFVGNMPANDERAASLVLSPTMLTHEASHESGSSSGEEEENSESRDIWALYRKGLSEYLWQKGYWVVLLSTSLTWACFDFAFYVMGPNSINVVDEVFAVSSSSYSDIYSSLMAQAWHSLVIVSLGSILGGMAMIFLIQLFSPRTLQLIGFLIVFVLFIIVGLVFRFIPTPSRTPLVVFLYVISMIFFQIGPNFTTYIIPSELFPTQFRCTAVGISAAAGKTAAVIVQVIASLANLGSRVELFSDGVLVFSAFMLIGAALTQWLTPETRSPNGKPKPLEKLEHIGKTWPIDFSSSKLSKKSESTNTSDNTNSNNAHNNVQTMSGGAIDPTIAPNQMVEGHSHIHASSPVVIGDDEHAGVAI